MKINTLIQRCHFANIKSEMLDNIIHDEMSKFASAINNNGIGAQLDYLLKVFGEKEFIKLIKTKLDIDI